MRQVPFYANTEDDTHCFQASMRMILKYFLPDAEFSWQELDKLSAKQPGLATWPQQMMIELYRQGFEVVMVEGFDGPAFVAEGANYLHRAFGAETADWQTNNSNLAQEQRIYKELLALPAIIIETRIPTIAEVATRLKDGYLINMVINSRKLNARPGYVGHSVVVYAIDDTNVTLHDPGLPPQPHRQVGLEAFEAAWAWPNATAKNYIAIKLKKEARL